MELNKKWQVDGMLSQISVGKKILLLNMENDKVGVFPSA
jgi:hypothetical protein